MNVAHRRTALGSAHVPTFSSVPSGHMSHTPSREHDLVIFGATSFVGKLIAKYVALNAADDTRVALAGRNEDKLRGVRASLPGTTSGWSIITADTDDAEDMSALAESAAVIISTVGPYNAYGRKLVGACAAAGTHYLDLAGEVLFVRDSILDNDETARASGARIIHSCGFDSVPSDVALYRLWQKQDSRLGDVEMVVSDLVGGMSGGTFASALDNFDSMDKLDSEQRTEAESPFALSPRYSSEKDMKATGVKKGLAPFFMAQYNTRLIRRTAQVLDYGRDFTYSEYQRVGGPVKTAVFTAGLAAGAALLGSKAGRNVAGRFLPKPGEGPSSSDRAKGRFTLDTREHEHVHIELELDPGYEGTALMISEAAFTLLDGEGLPERAGVLTPASALGDAYIDRLRAAGMLIS